MLSLRQAVSVRVSQTPCLFTELSTTCVCSDSTPSAPCVLLDVV